jgi:hypothetical protein
MRLLRTRIESLEANYPEPIGIEKCAARARWEELCLMPNSSKLQEARRH